MVSWLECQVLSVRSRVQIRLPTAVIGLGCHRNPCSKKLLFSRKIRAVKKIPKNPRSEKYIYFLKSFCDQINGNDQQPSVEV